MIAEFGHYGPCARVLLWHSCRRASRWLERARNDPVLMAVAGPTAVAQFCFVALRPFVALMICYLRSDFFRPQRVRELAFGKAARLQNSPVCGGITKARCCCGFSF